MVFHERICVLRCERLQNVVDLLLRDDLVFVFVLKVGVFTV
jgi:hypothetical protein